MDPEPSELDQYTAVRRSAGIVGRASRGGIALSGRDRASYLQGLLTNDIAALAPGAGCYAAWLTPQGRMMADMEVLELGNRILLDVPGVATRALAQRLEQLIFSEEVTVSDLSEDWTSCGVHGPRAAVVVSGALGPGASSDEPAPGADRLAAYGEYENARWDFEGEPVIVSGSREFGEIGYHLYIARSKADSLRRALRGAGGAEVGAAAAEVLRVEEGRPLFTVDMDEQTIPLEAGIEDRAISFTKGCYVGQEVIVRVLQRGQGRIARKLVGLVLERRAEPVFPPAGGGDERASVPARGAPISAGDREVGHVTSAVVSPALGRPIALGYVHRDFIEPGTEVQVMVGATHVPATVTTLPFARPPGAARS